MSFKRDFECPSGWCDCDTCASMKGQEEDGTVICSQRPKQFKCPSCDRETSEILAAHSYSVRYDEEQGKWVKGTGEVVYVCGLCLEELDIRDIEDILKQVDEL